MPESFAAIATFFAGDGAVAGTAAAAGAEVGGSSALAIGAGAASAAGAAETSLASSVLWDASPELIAKGVAGTAGAGGLASALGKTAGQVGTAAVASSLLAPKRPDLPKPLPMPDPQAQEEARRRSLIEQMARRGRASTILTDAGGSGTLGA